MSSFIFCERITGEFGQAEPGGFVCIPSPHIGDRVQLRHTKCGLVQLTLDKEWATVTAVSPKRYLIVEPDIKPGEIRISTHDLSQYNMSGIEEEVPIRNVMSLEDWRKLRGDTTWLDKERKYRRKLRAVLRSVRDYRERTRTLVGTTE